MTEDRVMSAAEADNVECVRMLEVHQRDCDKHQRGKPCSECYGLGRHVERTEKQIKLLSAPGETQELF